MKLRRIFTYFLLLVGMFTYSQVGIGTDDPNPKSSLDVTSTTTGVLVPRMSTAQRDAIQTGATENGLTIFNTDMNCYNVWT